MMFLSVREIRAEVEQIILVSAPLVFSVFLFLTESKLWKRVRAPSGGTILNSSSHTHLSLFIGPFFQRENSHMKYLPPYLPPYLHPYC